MESSRPRFVARKAATIATPAGRRVSASPPAPPRNRRECWGVVRREGSWLAVQAPELRNGEVGRLPAEQARARLCALVAPCRPVEAPAGRAQRRPRGTQLCRGGRLAGAPDPAWARLGHGQAEGHGRRLPYGCCVLALSGDRLRLPAGWPGGDRPAVHATNDLSSIGRPVSLGCMRTDSRRARWLIETIPLGAPIFIRS
jgi:hypothetical protein